MREAIRKLPTIIWITGALIVSGASWARADSDVETLYRGNTVNLIIGASVGGGFDTYGRLVARHMSRHLPGNPVIVPQNMPGAGSNKAADYLYTLAPKDGTAFGIIFPGAVMTPLLEPGRGLDIDPTNFNFIGTANKETRVCAVAKRSAAQKFADMQDNEVILGASARGGSTADYPAVLNEVLGTKFRIIRGYKGTRDITHALERGEVDGICGWSWASLKTQKAEWLRDGTVNIVVQFGMVSDAELDKLGVPTVWTAVRSDADRKLLELLIGQQVFGRPFVAPPGVPAPVVEALRTAFVKTMADDEFLTEARQLKLELDYASGPEVQRVVDAIYATPKPVVARLIAAMKQE